MIGLDRIGALLLLAAMLVPAAQARVVEGVELAEQVDLAGADTGLVLNGAGVREKLFFDIYVAALYVPEVTRDAQRILDAGLGKRMLMRFVYSEVEKKKMDDAWDEGFAANLEAGQLAALQQRLDRFKGLFGNLKRGDEILLDYIPGTGTQVKLNGALQGIIEGGDFGSALFAVWLGRKPVTETLKRDLLGGS